MYILTQDKTKLLEFEKVELSKAFGTYSITAYGRGDMTFATVGQYKTEEEANAEFRHIVDALSNGQKVYEVR